MIRIAIVFIALAAFLHAAKPHMVIYLSDDHSQFDSSLYGNRNIPTPNFEKLAADGMTFTHAFVASPSCAPSRAAMLTGLMPARNGAEANHTFPKEGTHSLVADLKAAGYETAAFGKVAHGKSASRYGFDHVGGGSGYGNLKETVTEFLEKRASGKPLCLFAGISNPHVPWPESDRFDPAGVELPPHHLDTPATREHRARYYAEIAELDDLLGELRELAARHLGENVLFLHTSDHGSQWPFGKWNLYDYGTRVPFIAAWPGVIPAGTRSGAMVQWTDILPALIEFAGGEAPEGLDGRSIAGVLRGETTTHRDRIFTTHSGDGRMNIYPIRAVRTREWKLIRNLHPEFAHTNHSDIHRKPGAGRYWDEWGALVRKGGAAEGTVMRYYRRPEWELYRVEDDRWEMENLVDDPAHARTVSALKKELAGWMRDQGDQETVFNEPRLLADRKSWHPGLAAEAPAPKKPRKAW
jgi:uncharacterized sulfatase